MRPKKCLFIFITFIYFFYFYFFTCSLPLDRVESDGRRRRTTQRVVATHGVDEVVTGCDAGACATPTQRRAGAPAVCVWAVALHRAETCRTVTTTHGEQPSDNRSHAVN